MVGVISHQYQIITFDFRPYGRKFTLKFRYFPFVGTFIHQMSTHTDTHAP